MKKIFSLCRRLYKKAVVALGLAFAASTPALAEGAANNETAFDTTFVTSFLGKVSKTIEAFWTDNKDSLMVILGVIAVLALVWLAVRLFKRSTSKA